MRKEDWAAVICSVIFGLVGGFIAYEMRPVLCWVGALIGAALGFFMCEPKRVLDGLKYARTVYNEQHRLLSAQRSNFGWRQITGKMIRGIATLINAVVAFCFFGVVIGFWFGLFGYIVWWIGLNYGLSILVGMVFAIATLGATIIMADFDLSPVFAIDLYKMAFACSPITVVFYWLPHHIIPNLLPVWLRALGRAAKFFLGYLAAHQAVLVALSIFVGVVVGRFCGHVIFCGAISGVLCLMGILIRELTSRSLIKA